MQQDTPLTINQKSLLIPQSLREAIMTDFYPKVKVYGSDMQALESLALADETYITGTKTCLNCPKEVQELKSRWHNITKYWEELKLTV